MNELTRSGCFMDDLLETVLAAHGGLRAWSELSSITVDLSIGGPAWVDKGWPDLTLRESIEADPRHARSVFTPFAAPGLRAAFDVDAGQVVIENLDGEPVDWHQRTRQTLTGAAPSSPWDALRLQYFGYAFWNFFTAPFLLGYPGVATREIRPWTEAGRTWRRLAVTFPDTAAGHGAEQVFSFDDGGLQRRMDYVTELLGSTLVAHYTGGYRKFGGLLFPTRRRVYRRNPDGTPNLVAPSFAIDIHDVVLTRPHDQPERRLP